MNLYSSVNMNISGDSENRDYIFPINISLDTAFNIKTFVIEGDILFNYKEQLSVPSWNLRMIKDIKDLNLRLKTGTISYPVTSLQGFVPLNGMSIERNFGLNPYDNIQSLGSQSLIIDSPSQIEIFVNDRLLKKISLTEGRYDLKNLQLDSGANEIEIKIKELSGREESIFFSRPFNINLLQKGISDFSTAFGIYEGNMDKPYFSGYMRYGLSDVFTLGANLQSDFSMFNSGISLLLGTLIGNFSLESSISYDSGFDWAASLFYRYTNNRFPSKNNWSFSATFRGPNYNGLRLEKVNNTVPLRLGLYYGQIFPGGINGGLSLNRNYKSNWTEVETEIGINLSKHFGRGLLLNFNLNDKIQDDGTSDFSAGITLTVNLQERNETFTTSSSWPGTEIESSWQKSSKSRIPGYSLNAGVSGLPSNVENNPFGITLGGEYRAYKFTSSVNHNSTVLNTNDISLHNSSINFNSALVFADSTLAITRPVYDSFVIIKPSPSFTDFTVGINPEGKSYGALLNGKGPAVLPGFHSYRNGQIIMEAIDLPIGYDLGDSLYTFLPEYKSGAVITAGTEAVVFAGGTLTDEMGKSIALTAVSLKSLDDPSAEEDLFFTNRDGYFELYGLSEGKWRLELLEDRNFYADIIIPADNSGYFELWNVQLKK